MAPIGSLPIPFDKIKKLNNMVKEAKKHGQIRNIILPRGGK